MTSKSLHLGAGLPFLVLLTLGMGMAAPAQARQDCVGYKVIASGRPVHFMVDDQEEKARADAIAAWEYLAAHHAGADHARWPHADFRKIDCWLPNRSNYQCMAIGQPCTPPEEPEDSDGKADGQERD